MAAKSTTAKIIFGLKVRQLRQQQELSYADLQRSSGLSQSYLNEIEKGKKFPKGNKVEALAHALGVSADELTDPHLYGELSPVGDLLSSNFLSELPLELFGIELARVVDIIAKSPAEVGAFIRTLLDISRTYAVGETNFYFAALRSYLEMYHNYFPDLEQRVEEFARHNRLGGVLPTSTDLRRILEKKYGYTVVENGFVAAGPLEKVRSYFVEEHKRLLLSDKLTEGQRLFQLGKELGFNHLNLTERAGTSSLLRVQSFNEVLNHFQAGYFSAALLLRRDRFVRDLQDIFQQSRWEGERLTRIIDKYNVSSETFFQRMTNLVPQEFGIRRVFFFRFKHYLKSDTFKIDKELHLDHRHIPHGNGLREHYCRRWLAISVLNDLHRMQREGRYVGNIIGVQRNRYPDSDEEYLVITLARSNDPEPGVNISMSFGMVLDERAKRVLRFWDDPAVRRREVGTTCERCPIQDCKVRAAPPVKIEKRERRRRTEEALRQLAAAQH